MQARILGPVPQRRRRRPAAALGTAAAQRPPLQVVASPLPRAQQQQPPPQQVARAATSSREAARAPAAAAAIRLTQTGSQRPDGGLISGTQRVQDWRVQDSNLHAVKTGHSDSAAFPAGYTRGTRGALPRRRGRALNARRVLAAAWADLRAWSATSLACAATEQTEQSAARVSAGLLPQAKEGPVGGRCRCHCRTSRRRQRCC
jgi:hypothetical protein